MLIYEVLTWLIILLGKLRYCYLKKFYWKTGFCVRKDRNLGMSFYKSEKVFEFGCCDCGLVHSIENHFVDWYPVRPRDYKYKLR